MPIRSDLEWIAFATAAAVAAHFAAAGGTPVDQSLPFIAVLVAVTGWLAAARLVQIAVPLLIVAAIAIPDAPTRLFAFGIIAAAAFAWALGSGVRHWALIIPGVMLLRWIPLNEVVWWREIVVLAGAICVGLAVRRDESPAPVVAALLIALVTPTDPARLLLFPFVIALLFLLPLPRIVWAVGFAIAAGFARYSIATVCTAAAFALLVVVVEDNRHRLSPARVPVYALCIALFAFWPWSGIVARSLPRFLSAERTSAHEQAVWVALEGGRSVSMTAPPGAHVAVLTASVANASRLPAGWVVGRAEVVGRNGKVIERDLRIGDIADFGFTRREHFFASRNPIPLVPLDDVKGYGISAWLHTAGRVTAVSAEPIAAVRVTAAAGLPPATKLQVESIEFE